MFAGKGFFCYFCNMIRLTEHIAYLLTCHDCVIVPGWGAFISQRTSASFDSVTGVFTPPCRSITFNATIADTDGLLASSVSRRERMPYARAVDCVAAEIDSWRHQLDRDGELVIPRVGTFRRSADGTSSPIFEPATDGVTNSPFAPFASLALDERKPSEEPGKIAPDKISRNVRPSARRRRLPAFVRIAAAMALLLGTGFAVTAPDQGDTRTDYASMTPSSAQRPSEILTDDVQQATELFISQPTDPDSYAEVDNVDSQAVAVRQTEESAPQYCLIVASLPSKSLANRFIAASGDASLRILVSDGHYRVYVAGGDSYASAYSHKASVAHLYPDAWVCRR